jgi:hypothetical protein
MEFEEKKIRKAERKVARKKEGKEQKEKREREGEWKKDVLRVIFFNLFWFAAPLRSLKKFGDTPNWLKMTIWRHLM